MSESREIARLYVDYCLPGTDLRTEDEQIKTIKEVFEGIKQKHSLEGNAWVSTPNRIYVELVQAPQILKAALEDLINSELGVPDIVHPVASFWGREKREEELGIKIAQRVLGDAGYLLRPHRSFHVFTDYYSLEKNG